MMKCKHCGVEIAACGEAWTHTQYGLRTVLCKPMYAEPLNEAPSPKLQVGNSEVLWKGVFENS